MTVFFRGISFVWALGALAAIAVLLGLRAWLAYGRLNAEAEADWNYQVAQNMQDLRLTKDSYTQVYCKVNAPRLPLYLAAGAALILALTPIVFGVLNVLLWGVWKLSDNSRVFEPGYLVWEFFIFFGLIAAWALIGAGVARRYHAHSPGLMRDELIEARADFTPTQPLTLGPNPVHILAGSKGASYKEMFENALGLTHTRDKNWNQSGHVCDIYCDGSDMQICVHSETKGTPFDVTTHPFFFAQKHAREQVEETRYMVIRNMDNIDDAFNKIAALDLEMEKITGNKHSKMRSFAHENVDIFLYEGKENTL